MELGLQTKEEITQVKETLEDNQNLVKVGRRLKIKKFILLGRGEKDLWRTGEETILADTVEALIGAIFLDSDAGFGIVRQVIRQWFEPDLRRVKKEKPVEKKVILPFNPLPVSSRRGAPRRAKRQSQRSSRGQGVARTTTGLPSFPRKSRSLQ
jgi:dsRNA-specific ribonuclease